MDDCVMNPPETHPDKGAGAVAPRVPDYKPRDRLDPKWRPGASVRVKTAPRSLDVIDDPWMYSQRSLREHRRLLPAQRIMVGLLLAVGVAAAGLLGLGMRGPDERRHWSAPARPAGVDQDGNTSALRVAPEPVPGLATVASPARVAATPFAPENAADARGGPSPGRTKPAPDVDSHSGSGSGMGPATVLSVTPVLAEQAQAPVVAQVAAHPTPPSTPPAGDDVRPARRARTEAGNALNAGNAACSEAQQAMQLCGVTGSAGR